MDSVSLMLWVHCNSCLRQIKDDRNLDMYFTSCGHFFCQHCVQKHTSPKCSVCDVKDVRTMALGPDVSPGIMEMFQNAGKLPQKLHRAIDFQHGHIRQTLNLNGMKAQKMSKTARKIAEECKTYKQMLPQIDQECKELEYNINKIKEDRKRRTAVNMNYHAPVGQTQSLPHGRPSHTYQSSTWMGQPARPETPSFADMEVNAFDPKTPDAFKMGKLLLSNAVTLQVMQQEPSPGNHVRNLFSPKRQGEVVQQEPRRLSGGSSGGRVNMGLGLGSRQSPFAASRGQMVISPKMSLNSCNTGYPSLGQPRDSPFNPQPRGSPFNPC